MSKSTEPIRKQRSDLPGFDWSAFGDGPVVISGFDANDEPVIIIVD